MSLKIKILIPENVADDVKKVLHGYSTSDGIKMLTLDEDIEPYNLNYAGNKYLDSLCVIRDLMKHFDIDEQLHE